MKELDELKRENYQIKQFDKEYCELLKKILNEGELFENRTGVDTLSIEGVNFKFDLNKEFPILESKKIILKNALSEILWIYQARSNDVSWLKERGNNIWNEWEIDDDGIYREYEKSDIYIPEKEVNVVDINGKVINNMKAKSKIEGKTIKSAKFFGKEYKGTIGTAYGWIINEYRRLDYVLNALKVNPHDRRMIISLWQDIHIKTAVLPSCVWSTEWKVSKGKLNLYVHQRSADVPLGLPFNVSQYAILQHMLAKVSNLDAGSLNYSIMDAHIYVNQINGINKQLHRYEKMQKYQKLFDNVDKRVVLNEYKGLKSKIELLEKFDSNLNERLQEELKELKDDMNIFDLMLTKQKPTLLLSNKDNFYEFSNKINSDKEYLKKNATGNEDIKLLNYKSAPFISMPVAQ